MEKATAGAFSRLRKKGRSPRWPCLQEVGLPRGGRLGPQGLSFSDPRISQNKVAGVLRRLPGAPGWLIDGGRDV